MAVPNGEFKFAQNLKRGESIITFDFEKQAQVEEKIESILIEPVESYAAPLTMSGTMLVDGILVSNYALIDNHYLAHIGMAPARWWYTIHGLLNQAIPESLSASLQIEKQMNGAHWYPSMLYSLTSSFLDKIVNLS